VLKPLFSQAAIESLRPQVQKLANDLVLDRRNAPTVDGARDYARPLNARTVAIFLGLPERDGAFLQDLTHQILDQGMASSHIYLQANRDLNEFIAKAFTSGDFASDGAFSYLCRYRLDGCPLSSAAKIDLARTLLVAGMDTTASVLGASLHHLALHPEELSALVEKRDLHDGAIEEFLRLYAPVTTTREIMQDTEIGGVRLRRGELLMLSFAAANRDQVVFPRGSEADFKSQKNPHLAFGAGIHRCLGLHLARLILRIGLQTFITAFPRFDLKEPPVWSKGVVRGPLRLRLNL